MRLADFISSDSASKKSRSHVHGRARVLRVSGFLADYHLVRTPRRLDRMQGQWLVVYACVLESDSGRHQRPSGELYISCWRLSRFL